MTARATPQLRDPAAAAAAPWRALDRAEAARGAIQGGKG